MLARLLLLLLDSLYAVLSAAASLSAGRVHTALSLACALGFMPALPTHVAEISTAVQTADATTVLNAAAHSAFRLSLGISE